MTLTRDHVTRKLVYSLAFTVAVALLLSYALWETQGFRTGRAAQFPRVVIVPALLLCALQVVMEVRRTVRNVPPSQIMDLAFESDLAPEVVRRRIRNAFCWVFGFVLVTWLLGFHVAMVAFVPAYLLVEGRVRWWWAVAATALMWVLIIVVLENAFRTNVPVGWLIGWP